MPSERIEQSESEDSENGERDDPEVRESVDSFRRAGSAVSDGLGTLYEWSLGTDFGTSSRDRRHAESNTDPET
jgi:hypothetical protein